MSRRVVTFAVIGMLAAAVFEPPGAFAQVGSVTATAPLATSFSALWSAPSTSGGVAIAATLTVLVNAGGAQNIASLVDNRINPFPVPVNISTSWNLATIVSAVDLVAYFTTPTAALTSGPNTIPSSRMRGRVVTGIPTTFTAFAQNPVGGVGTPGGSLYLFRQLILWPFNTVGGRTDNLELQLDLRGLPNLPAGTYAGTLNIRAVAY
jgi:hypothetical protein